MDWNERSILMRYYFDGESRANGQISNMDSLIVRSREIMGEEVLLAIICDGVGSMRHGGYASAKCANALSEWLDELESIDRIGERMCCRVRAINAGILEESKSQGIDTATTISVLILAQEDYHIIHAGDSRIYAYEKTELSQLTQDDVSQRGRLTNYIGKEGEFQPQYIQGCALGKAFLLCSDGLYRTVKEDILSESLDRLTPRTIRKITQQLVEKAVASGERDNISVALVKTV